MRVRLQVLLTGKMNLLEVKAKKCTKKMYQENVYYHENIIKTIKSLYLFKFVT